MGAQPCGPEQFHGELPLVRTDLTGADLDGETDLSLHRLECRYFRADESSNNRASLTRPGNLWLVTYASDPRPLTLLRTGFSRRRLLAAGTADYLCASARHRVTGMEHMSALTGLSERLRQHELRLNVVSNCVEASAEQAGIRFDISGME